MRLLSTADDVGGRRADRYALTIQTPRSSLRDRLARGLGVRGPARFWLEAWVDADGLVRRIATRDHEPDEDGGLPRGAVRTIVDFDDLGAPAPVEIPPTDS